MTCGDGQQYRTRSCEAGSCGGSNLCAAGYGVGSINTDQQVCRTGICCAQDGAWKYGAWSQWTTLCPQDGVRQRSAISCSAKCGGTCGSPAIVETRDAVICATTTSAAPTPPPQTTSPESGGTATTRSVFESTATVQSLVTVAASDVDRDNFARVFTSELKANAAGTERAFSALVTSVTPPTSSGTETTISVTIFVAASTAETEFCNARAINNNGRLLNALKDDNPGLWDKAQLQLGSSSGCSSCECDSVASANGQSSGGNAATIAGAVAGSVAALTIIIGAFLYVRWTKKHDEEVAIYEDALAMRTNPLYNEALASAKERQASKKGGRKSSAYTDADATPMPTGRASGGFNDYLAGGGTTAGVAAGAPAIDMDLRRKMSAPAMRRESSGSAVVPDEPDAIILKESVGFSVLARIGKGRYQRATHSHLGEEEGGKHMIAARRPGGGYAILTMRDSYGYAAVRTSRVEDELVVVQTRMSKPAVLIRRQGVMQPMPNLSGVAVDPAVLFGVDTGAGDVMHMLVVHKERDSDGRAIVNKPPLYMILRQGANANFEIVHQPEAFKVGDVVTAQTRDRSWMLLQKQPAKGIFMRLETRRERPPGSSVGQGVTLLHNEYKEILTGRGKGESTGPLVSLLHQTADESEEGNFTIMERSDEGVYKLAPFADEGGPIKVHFNDGTALDLKRSDESYLNIAPSAEVEDFYMEVITGTNASGEAMSVLRSNDGRYTLLQEGKDNEYIRPDLPNTQYMTQSDLKEHMKRVRLAKKPSSSDSVAGSSSSKSNSMSKGASFTTSGGAGVGGGSGMEVASGTAFNSTTGSQAGKVSRKESSGSYADISAPASRSNSSSNVAISGGVGGGGDGFSRAGKGRASQYNYPGIPSIMKGPGGRASASGGGGDASSRNSGNTGNVPPLPPPNDSLAEGVAMSYEVSAPAVSGGVGHGTRKQTRWNIDPQGQNVQQEYVDDVRASNKVDGTRAQRLIQAFGNHDASYVLQGDGGAGKIAWLHLMFKGACHLFEIEIIPTMQRRVTATSDGEFMAQSLRAFVDKYSQNDQRDLPVALGTNLTPRD